jgi:hypothetical protein
LFAQENGPILISCYQSVVLSCLHGYLPLRLCAFARDSVTREQAGFDQLAQRDPDPPGPIVDVKIENPYNLQDFQNDKLSILDEFWLSVRSVIVG